MTLRVGQEVTLRRALPRTMILDGGRERQCDRGPKMGEVHRIAWLGEDTSPEGVTCEWLELEPWSGFLMPSLWFEPVVKPKREASTETGMKLLREIAAHETLPSERERLKQRKRSKVPADSK